MVEELMGDRKIEDSEHSQELVYDKKFIKRWTDRCWEIRNKYGQQEANRWASSMFSQDVIKLINAEIARRKAGGQSKQ